jgi:mitochondrial chaperone BCS1
VLTTDHRERLDSALIRPGRIDLEIELDRATPSQLRGLLQHFYPDHAERVARIAADYPTRTLSPAQVQQTLIAADTLDKAEAGLRAAWEAAATSLAPPVVT